MEMGMLRFSPRGLPMWHRITSARWQTSCVNLRIGLRASAVKLFEGADKTLHAQHLIMEMNLVVNRITPKDPRERGRKFRIR